MFRKLAINYRPLSFSIKERKDCAGRRISIRKGGEAMGPLAGSVVTCAYDHMGRNVMKDGVRFVWDGYNITVENLGASNETHNVWGLDLDGTIQGAGGVGGLLAVEKGGSIAFPAYDANGNITEYVSGGGVILSHSEYSSFGRELVHTGSDGFTHRFSTKPYCRKTGVLEFQLRRYRPRCGRWMNRDAIEEEGGLNLYGYVGNGVLMNVDLLGNECFCGEEISAVLAVGPRFQNIFLGQGDYEENEQNYMRPIVRSFAESAFSCNSKLSIAYLCC